MFQEYLRETIDEDNRKAAVLARRGEEPIVKSFDDRQRESVELLVACTTGFRNVFFNGPLEFSQANAFKLYHGLPWVRDQVDKAIGNLENFIKA
jgi:hypothetical protein